ncbi:MAG: hypothetical protein HY744_08260 [Deltaproteobacteria bacterium]|nr:hypothetical protein [Deltaproteobacteria bacterium]
MRLGFGPVRRRLTQLGPQEREQLFARAAASRVYLRRASFTSLRALLTMGYLDDRRVAAAIGLAAATDPFGLATSAPPAQGAPT